MLCTWRIPHECEGEATVCLSDGDRKQYICSTASEQVNAILLVSRLERQAQENQDCWFESEFPVPVQEGY